MIFLNFLDPFGGGSDPFSSDPFASVTTPKASDQVGVVCVRGLFYLFP